MAPSHSIPPSSIGPDEWHREPSPPHGKSVRIEINGESFSAFEGESLAVALAVNGILVLRHSPGLNQARGMFCLMGVCQECRVQVDGETTPSCMEPVREGMRVLLEPLKRASPPKDGS